MPRPAPPHCLIRADASPKMGIGHVMRCLALGRAWQDAGGRVTFLASCPDDVHQWLRDAGFEVRAVEAPHPDPVDLDQLLRLAREAATDHSPWIVLDGYHFDQDYQRAVREQGLRLLVVDDYRHLPGYHAELLLNQNPGADQLAYQTDPDTRLLAGMNHVMLRREILALPRRDPVPRASRLLITLGGSDPHEVAEVALQTLRHPDFASVRTTLLAGPANPAVDRLTEQAKQVSGECRVLRSASRMDDLYREAEAVLTSAGSTCWELCFQGLPFLAVRQAENQVPVSAGLRRMVPDMDLGGYENLTPDSLRAPLRRLLEDQAWRLECSRTIRRHIDGQGLERILAAMTSGQAQTPDIRLRPARPEDRTMLLCWRNDALSRANSLDTGPVPPEAHDRWFAKALAGDGIQLRVAETPAGLACGVVRAQTGESGTLLSWTVAPAARGRGLGAAMTTAFVRDIEKPFFADIRSDNRASVRIAEALGMTPDTTNGAFVRWKKDPA